MQSADYTMGGHKETFRPMQLFEAGMVATDSTHHHSTNRTSFWNYNKASELYQITQSPRTVTAPPQSTISWSQGQATLHCNLATQLQCSNARSQVQVCRI